VVVVTQLLLRGKGEAQACFTGIELRNHFFQVPTLLLGGEGNTDRSVICELREDLAESEHLGMRGYFRRDSDESGGP
jgi:hypothetical protein